jgi:uncharacterized iron-regulated protein
MTPIKIIYVFSVLIILFSSTLGSPAVAQVLTKKVDPLRPIIEIKTQKTLTVEELIEKLKRANYTLLGEFHDNASHHQLRGDLILRLNQSKQTVVVEYLLAGKEVQFSGSTLESLHTAGFNSKAWSWSIYGPLFEQLRMSQRPIVGSNLDRSISKVIFSGENNPIPSSLKEDYQKSPLSAPAMAALEQDLIEGHCGKLPPAYLKPMMLVQRLTDISMARVLLEHSSGILLAGNGHIRKDYGVPQVLKAIAPHQSVVNVAFTEDDGLDSKAIANYRDRYDYVWLTKPIERKDPCADLQFGKPSS